MTYRQSKIYDHKIPQKLTTTACFIQGEPDLPPEDSPWMKLAVGVSLVIISR